MRHLCRLAARAIIRAVERFLATEPPMGWTETADQKPEPMTLRQVTDTAWISLSDLLRDYLPGSHPQPWTWHDEAAYLDAVICACCDQPGHYQQQLEEWLRSLGHVPQGICLGGDGRVWDGHHRVVAAFRLGFPGLPVENDLEDTPMIRRTIEPPKYWP